MVNLYTEPDLFAEVPGAVARAQATINRDDARCIAASDLQALPLPRRRARLRQLVEDGYEAVDQQHAQLRSFRNIVLMSAVLFTLLVGVTVAVVSMNPTVLPLCFPHQVTAAGNTIVESRLNCPSRSNTSSPSGGDVWMVALMGLLGGALATSVSIRNLRGTSTPYDVPVALAMLKVPLGAFTAMVGLVAIQSGFIPGLSVLDSQQQILAYALILGFGQQVFTRLLDRQAQTLLSGLPSKDVAERPEPAPRPTGPAPSTATQDAVPPVVAGGPVDAEAAGTGQQGSDSNGDEDAPPTEPQAIALVETGNYPDPDDGPQDDLEQVPTPQFDEHLVDGAGSEAES